MKRTLLSVAAIGLAITSISSCSDKSTTAPDGTVAANASTDAYRSVSSVTVSLLPTSVTVGDSATATAVLRDYWGRIVTGSVTWTSNAPSIATVSAVGLVRSVAAGTASIKATHGWRSGSATLTVTSQASTAVVSTVAVSLASSTITPGQSTQATATTRDSSNNVLTGRVITWSSGNTAVSTVSASGLVTAVAAGATAITALSETKTGSSAITVSAAAPVPVASVSVSPAAPSILVGSTVQLSATTRDASNNVLTSRVVTWSSSNTAVGGVSASGLVTAVSAGTIQVTATSEGKTGSASITVSVPPPPPPAGSSNEPSGMTLLTERPFNSLTENAGWITQGLSIAQDASAPKSPTSVIRATYQTGFVGGSAPGVAEFSHPGHRVIYISYWAKLSSNFWGHLTSVNKQFYEWGNGIGLFYFEAAGVGSEPLEPRVVLQGTPADAVLGPNLVPNATIPRGVWYNVEIVLNGNSSGAADGTVDWWLNGVHVGSYSGRRFTSGATVWGIFQFEPVWGGVTDAVPATMTQDWDHLYISGKN